MKQTVGTYNTLFKFLFLTGINKQNKNTRKIMHEALPISQALSPQCPYGQRDVVVAHNEYLQQLDVLKQKVQLGHIQENPVNSPAIITNTANQQSSQTQNHHKHSHKPCNHHKHSHKLCNHHKHSHSTIITSTGTQQSSHTEPLNSCQQLEAISKGRLYVLEVPTIICAERYRCCCCFCY